MEDGKVEDKIQSEDAWARPSRARVFTAPRFATAESGTTRVSVRDRVVEEGGGMRDCTPGAVLRVTAVENVGNNRCWRDREKLETLFAHCR